jgi:excisionase family DNA binding protein
MAMNTTVFVAMPFVEFQELIQQAVNAAFEKYTKQLFDANNSEELMSVEEAGAFLHVSKVTIFKWKKNKKIASYRFGRKIYFKKQELLNSMDSLTAKRKLLLN